MKKIKTIIEILVWLLLYLPMYFGFKYLDYLTKNVWGTRYESLAVQLTVSLFIVLWIAFTLYFVYEKILYKKQLLEISERRVKTLISGRGILNKLFNKKYQTFIDSGVTYFVDGATKWFNDKGEEVGRISWIDKELEKERILKYL